MQMEIEQGILPPIAVDDMPDFTINKNLGPVFEQAWEC